MNRNAAATIPAAVFPLRLLVMARTTMLRLIPMAPMSMRGRRPMRSMVKTGMNEARKYSVPLQAARMREMNPLRPIWFS